MHEFLKPSRQILCKDDLERFNLSETKKELIQFLVALNNSVVKKSLCDSVEESEAIRKLVQLFEFLTESIALFPPEKQMSRFGSPMFQQWLDHITQEINPYIFSLGIPEESLVETKPYLMSSFGHRQRIDYGTGNEMNFVCFIYCLYHLGIVKDNDFPGIVLRVFDRYNLQDINIRYLRLMRKLQFTYLLEPAGSHGVWGLDDYHFLPFLFGSAQLIDHPYIKPKSIHDPEVIEGYAKHYFYLSCIEFVNKVKTASLRWHSPMLDDISAAKSWKKINEGLFKMLDAEILSKFPIMQHFLFGSFLRFEISIVSDKVYPYVYEKSHEEECDHRLPGELPSCCVMKVPSAIAARPELLPFD
ncbi:rotamase PTPA-2 [Rozella allomycis CSF55]|uniref:Serine/threonine-protein phosphatase 2A activator n=1 Tax=Rozella allomycis (strain CSF55) TaxID=988480 RepID=A0A075B1B3_ROZAC|nr:Phosphotyrosyl phosphatase activator, PTPA domain-containing protein [Rozella allomycis CSF55]RKP18609.1 rotamase PTPA-2 [Rozella allomycis CSF55]|eukprot:EPZ36381.1 Phosphotyrosyl phosphatase activator, PTPA domain-containing protein [Rozella allomycis CSF55]